MMRGLCKIESMKDGTLDLCDIAHLNDMLDVDDENRARVAEWANKNGS